MKKKSFACYLYANDKIVEKKLYQSAQLFVFKINTIGNYRVRVFIKSEKSGERFAKNFPIGFIFNYTDYYKLNEKRFINAKNLLSGTKYLNQRVLCFSGFPEYEVCGNNFFDLDPFGNRTWRWNLLQLSLLNNILSCYSVSGGVELLQLTYDFICEWNEYKINNLSDKEVWHDHGSALRLKNISFYFIFSLKENYITFESKRYNVLLDVIKEHIEFLTLDKYYSKNTNHGFDQSLILYQTCLELRNLLNVDDNLKIAELRIIDEIKYAFCSDGGHKENSPAYLNFGIKQCLSALRIEKSYKGKIEEFIFLKDILDIATDVLTHTVKPDGLLPLIGDTSIYKVTNLFLEYKPRNYNNFIYSISKGLRGTKPKRKLLILPETGYLFYRNHWDKNGFDDAVYLSLKCGYKSNYHRHDDDLSITIYGFKEDWLIDGGIYKYDNHDLHRKYIRSYRSHNIFSPKNGIAKRNLSNGHAYFSRISSSEIEGGFDVVAESEMFVGYRARREILIKDTSFLIKDQLNNISDNGFEGVLRYFIPNNKSVIIIGNKIIIKGEGKQMEILIESDSIFEISHVVSPKNKIEGWLSSKNGHLEQSNLIQIQVKEKHSSLITLFSHVVFNNI